MEMANKRISVPAFHQNIETLCNKVQDAAVEAGFDDRTAYACQLATGEACENVINHGYANEGDGELILTIKITQGQLIIELCDTAPPFNPSIYPQDEDWEEEDPPIGGLGLKIIHKVMDKVSYTRRNGRNYLEMHKTDPYPHLNSHWNSSKGRT